MIIGICGKSGSGKSTLARNIIDCIDREVVYLDIDKIGHHVLQIDRVKEELVRVFGLSIISNNSVDRKKLGKIVFRDKEEMNKLTDITWKYMEEYISSVIKDNSNKIIILDWILLPKTVFFDECNIKVLLDISYDVREKRAIIRDGITKDDFFLRDSSSIEYNNNEFDYVFSNNKDINIGRMVKSL